VEEIIPQQAQNFPVLESEYAYVFTLGSDKKKDKSVTTQKYFDAVVPNSKVTIILADSFQELALVYGFPEYSFNQVLVKAFMMAVDWLRHNAERILDLECQFEIVTLSQIIYPEIHGTKIQELFVKGNIQASLENIAIWAEAVSKRLNSSEKQPLLKYRLFEEMRVKINIYSSKEELRELNSIERSKRDEKQKRSIKLMSRFQKCLADCRKTLSYNDETFPDNVCQEVVLYWWLKASGRYKTILYSQENLDIEPSLRFVRDALLKGTLLNTKNLTIEDKNIGVSEEVSSPVNSAVRRSSVEFSAQSSPTAPSLVPDSNTSFFAEEKDCEMLTAVAEEITLLTREKKTMPGNH
jgi:hypothetical protein